MTGTNAIVKIVTIFGGYLKKNDHYVTTPPPHNPTTKPLHPILREDPPLHHLTTSPPFILHPSPFTLRQILHQGFHHFPRLKLQWPIGIGGREKVGPLENFGEAELVQGNDDGGDGLLGADDENFDGLSTTNFCGPSASCTRSPLQSTTGRIATN